MKRFFADPGLAGRIGRTAAWLVPGLFLAFFFLFPLAVIFRTAGQAALADGLGGASAGRIARTVAFTFWQAGLSTLLTLLAGLPAAYLFGRFQFPGRRLLLALSGVPFILPTVVAAAGFNALLGPRGWLNEALSGLFGLSTPPIQVLNTFGAILLGHVFYNTGVVARMVGAAWERLDPRLEHAARALGASPLRALSEVTLPLLRPSILAAGLLVFIFDFTSFGVVLLLGGPRFATLEVEIYVQAMQMLNLPLAGALSALQMAITLALTLLYTRLDGRRAAPSVPRVRGETLRRPRTRAEKALVVGVPAALLLVTLAPLAALAARSLTGEGPAGPGWTTVYYQALFSNPRGSLFYVPPIRAALNSLVVGAATTVLALGMGFPAAYALARPGGGPRWLSTLLMLPLGASAVTLGLGFVVAFNRPPLDARSFPLLVPIAHSLVALPFVVRTLTPAIASIPAGLRQAAAVLGASPARVWREVDLPVLARAALSGAVFAFTVSLGEFGATALLARPEFPTLPVAIFRYLAQPGALNYGQAMAMATLLMVLCAAGILILDRIEFG